MAEFNVVHILSEVQSLCEMRSVLQSSAAAAIAAARKSVNMQSRGTLSDHPIVVDNARMPNSWSSLQDQDTEFYQNIPVRPAVCPLVMLTSPDRISLTKAVLLVGAYLIMKLDADRI